MSRKNVWVLPYDGTEGYLHAEASDVTGYKQWKKVAPDGASATEESASMGATGEVQVGSSFITGLLNDTVYLENSNWRMQIWSYLTGGTAYLRAKIYRYRDGVETLLFTTSDSPAVGTSYSKIIWVYQAIGTFELLPTDRLIVKIFANRTVKAAGKKIYIAYDNSTRDSLVVDPSIVATTSNLFAVFYPYQRKSFYAGGLHWEFYTDGTNLCFRTSSDGISWSSATTVRACTDGRDFSIWFDGTYVYYVYSATTSSIIYFRRGTPNSDGTITWSATEQSITDESYNTMYPVVCVDSSGYPYIVYNLAPAASYNYVNVTRSSTNDGTWVTDTANGYPQSLTGFYSDVTYPSIVALTGRDMYVVYAGGYFYGLFYDYSANTWGSEEQISDVGYSSGNGMFHCEVADGDTVHAVFNAQHLGISPAQYDLYYDYRSAGHVWGTDVSIQANVGTSVCPMLCKHSSTVMYCFWAGKPTADHIYYKKWVSGSWDASPTDWINESTDHLTSNTRLNSFYQSSNNLIGVTYMTLTASPYNIRFATLSIVVVAVKKPIMSIIPLMRGMDLG